SCGSTACVVVLQRRVIGRPFWKFNPLGCCSTVLQRICADPSPAPELQPAFECPKPFSERRRDSDNDVLFCPGPRCRSWRSAAKPKQACNFKDLKGLKCWYTFGIRAENRTTSYQTFLEVNCRDGYFDLAGG